MRCKVFSFFSGSGFLDLGFETNGFDIEFVNEFSSTFMNAYQYSREKMGLRKPAFGYHNTDINIYLNENQNKLAAYISKAREDGSFIMFIGGPPCPDFSVAGKQRGKDGDNGKLSKSYIDTIIRFAPDCFLFENVKGLWRTAKHRAFFEELKTLLYNNGYVTTERLTNALEYGVPQDRDRILLFGIKKSLLDASRIDSNTILDFPWEKYQRYKLDDVKALKWPTKDVFVNGGDRECPTGIPKELTVQYWFDKNDVEHHPNAKQYFTPKAGLAKMQVIDEGDDSKKSYKRIHRWRYSPTCAYGNNEVHLHPYKERRLSAAETLSLQSLPKEFCLPSDMTLSAAFKTIGNGVPYLLSSGIAKTIYDYLSTLA